MLRALLIGLLSLLLVPAGARAACDPPTQPGVVVAICEGDAEVSGPGGADPRTYFDADPRRLADVRVVGRGTPVTVYVGRIDRDGVLMEATLKAQAPPAGEPMDVILRYEFALLESGGGTDEAQAVPRARRVLEAQRSPLRAAAVERVSAACIAFRADFAPHLVSAGAEGFIRQTRGIRRARARFARRLEAASRSAADRRHLRPLSRLVVAANRHLLAAERGVRRTRDVRTVERSLRAYERTLPRERRLRRRLGLSECG